MEQLVSVELPYWCTFRSLCCCTFHIIFSETGVSANNGKWLNAANGSELYWQAQTDGHSGGGNLFKMTRNNQEIHSFEAQLLLV